MSICMREGTINSCFFRSPLFFFVSLWFLGVGLFGFDGHKWKNTRKHVSSMLYLELRYTLVIFRVRGP